MRALRALTAVTIATLATVASASPIIVTQWGFTADSHFETVGGGACQFVDIIGGPPPGAPGGPTTCLPKLVAWGDVNPQSQLTWSGANAGGVLTSLDTSLTGGEVGLTQILTHKNNTIGLGSNFLDTVDVNLDLTITPQIPAFGALPPFSVTFNVNFKETVNAGPCPQGNSPCPDIFVISANLNKSEFWYNGNNGDFQANDPMNLNYTRYFLQIFPFPTPFGSLDDDACDAADANKPCVGFLTQEGEDNPKQFAFGITTERIDIPEPGVLALFALGLVGLGFTIRRRQV